MFAMAQSHIPILAVALTSLRGSASRACARAAVSLEV
jgi:hypothetical protein